MWRGAGAGVSRAKGRGGATRHHTTGRWRRLACVCARAVTVCDVCDACPGRVPCVVCVVVLYGTCWTRGNQGWTEAGPLGDPCPLT